MLDRTVNETCHFIFNVQKKYYLISLVSITLIILVGYLFVLKYKVIYREKKRWKNWSVTKWRSIFFSTPIDQGHKQNNATIKGSGGTIGLTERSNTLEKVMVIGPGLARMINWKNWDKNW